MKLRIRNLIILVFIITLGTSCNHKSKYSQKDLQHRISIGCPIPEGIMDTLLQEFKVPAISIATIHKGKIDWAKAYGVRKNGSPEKVDSLTIFQAASLSKPVSAVVALNIVDKEILDLDEDVNKKLVSWKIPTTSFNSKKAITLRHLLSHSAGLTMHGVPEFAVDAEIPSLIEILDGNWYGAKQSVRPVIEPGKEYRYSGGGYIILQLLLEDASNHSFEELAQKYVLNPANMTSSSFEQPLPENKWDMAAVGHLVNGKPYNGLWRILPEQATGGLWTTPTDLAKFMIEIRNAYKGVPNKLLPQYLAQEMLTRQVDDMGLGLLLPSYGVFRFSHTGANSGYRCFMVLSVDYPEGVVIMTNSDSGESLLWKVFDLVSKTYGWITE